jgi:hypothetical protein
MGINLLREVLKTTIDEGTKDKIQKRIKYLQDKYKSKNKPKLPTGAGSSVSSMDSLDNTLANEIKDIPIDVPEPIAKYLIDTDKKPNNLRELLDSINNNNYEMTEINIKWVKKI